MRARVRVTAEVKKRRACCARPKTLTALCTCYLAPLRKEVVGCLVRKDTGDCSEMFIVSNNCVTSIYRGRDGMQNVAISHPITLPLDVRLRGHDVPQPGLLSFPRKRESRLLRGFRAHHYFRFLVCEDTFQALSPGTMQELRDRSVLNILSECFQVHDVVPPSNIDTTKQTLTPRSSTCAPWHQTELLQKEHLV